MQRAAEGFSVRRNRRRARRAAALAGALLAASLLGSAPAAADDSGGSGFGMALASVGATLVYAPVKLCYALGGLLVTGLAYGLSGGDGDVVGPIFNASVRGDYVVSPAMLRGDEPIEFIGRSPENQQARRQSAIGGTDW